MKATFQHDYGLIKITGTDTTRFLQGQLTNDISQCHMSQYQLNAICNAEGRVLAICHLIKSNDNEYFMLAPHDLITKIIQHLQHYRLRAKVQFTDISLHEEAKLWQQKAHTLLPKYMPIITQATSLKFTAHSLNLDRLQGISFNKGCYIGQEIIARTHYRGQSKTSLYLLEITLNDDDDLKPGQTLFIVLNQIEQELGIVVNQVNAEITVENHCRQILAVLSNSLIEKITTPLQGILKTQLGQQNCTIHKIKLCQLETVSLSS